MEPGHQRLLNTHSDTAAFAKTKSAERLFLHTELQKHQTLTSPSLLPGLWFLCCSASLAICRTLPLGPGCSQDRFLLCLITVPADLRQSWCPTALLSTLHCPGATLSLLAPQAQGEEFLSTVIMLSKTNSPGPLQCTGISSHKIHSSYQNSSGTASVIFCLSS